MNIVYFGSSEFSRTVLAMLIAKGRLPQLVVTAPDKPAGRGLKPTPVPVKEEALRNGLSVFTPATLKDSAVRKRLEAVKPDIFIILGYGKIIPRDILAIPAVLPLGVHPSLLPLYRGAAPINWVLINGEATTGVTLFKVNERVDSGEIVSQAVIAIDENDTALTLSARLEELSARLVLDTLDSIEQGEYQLTPQDERRASFAPKLKKTQGHIDWSRNAHSIRNLIRGLSGWPGTFSSWGNTLIKIIEAGVQPEDSGKTSGTIISAGAEGIGVACGKGTLLITKLKPQGKKEMTAEAFLCGHALKVGDKLT